MEGFPSFEPPPNQPPNQPPDFFFELGETATDAGAVAARDRGLGSFCCTCARACGCGCDGTNMPAGTRDCDAAGAPNAAVDAAGAPNGAP